MATIEGVTLDNLTEIERTDLVPATTGEISKFFNVIPANNKRFRGRDIARRATPGNPTNEDTRVLMAFVKVLYNAMFNGEWADVNTLELAPNGKIRVKDVFVDGDRKPAVNGGNDFYLIDEVAFVDELPSLIGDIIQSDGGLTVVNNKLSVKLKSNGGLKKDNNGLFISLKNNGGLAIDTSNNTLYVDLSVLLGSNGGLEMVDGKLKIKLKNDGGLSLGSDGLYVDGSSFSSLLADGITIVNNDGKLTVDLSNATAAALKKISQYLAKSGGGLSMDQTTGQLQVDFTDLTVEQVWALCEPGGGIAVDTKQYLAEGETYTDRDGLLPGTTHTVTAAQAAQTAYGFPNPNYKTLFVDFSRIDDNTKDAILAGLDLPVPLRSNLTLYVDPSASGASDGYWGSARPRPTPGEKTADRCEKRFVTIQACVNFAVMTFNVGNFYINIRIADGTYTEALLLPAYSRGSGYIALRPMTDPTASTDTKGVKIVSPEDASGLKPTTVAASGGSWRLYYLKAERTESAMTDATASGVGSCYTARNNAELYLWGCDAVQKLPANAGISSGNAFSVRLFNVDSGGALYWEHGILPGVIETHLPTTSTNYPGSVDVISVQRGGTVWLLRSRDENASPQTTPDVECSGSCTTFMHAWQNGTVSVRGSGTLTTFTGTMTGRRFAVETASSVVAGPKATYFPGDTAGVVNNGEDSQPQEFCLYTARTVAG